MKKRATFTEGALVALAAAITGSVLLALPVTQLPGDLALRLLVAGAGLAYVVYLLSRSPERIGRVTVIAGWIVVAVLIDLMSPSMILYIGAHVGLIWLIRSLYFYTGILPALADLGLNGLSLAAASWALLHTGSIFLTLWCFFLTQALFTAIPDSVQGKRAAGRGNSKSDDRFERAHQVAEAAVRKLSNVR